MIYSIGYQRITIFDLIRTMKERSIQLLVDVRSRPYSRRPDKYEFNKNRLTARFAGDPSGGYHHYHWAGDRLGGLFGPVSEDGLRMLKESHERGNVMILMCMEHNPRDCHRFQDIGMRLLDHGIDVIHIHDGIEETTSQIIKELIP